MTEEHFAPSINVNGRTVTPEGWMWVLGFALSGCEWALAEFNRQEFREMVANGIREKKRNDSEYAFSELEKRITSIRLSMTPNTK